MNTDAKKEIIQDFMAGGYLSKDKQNTTKPAKSKIDRYAIIFTSTKNSRCSQRLRKCSRYI